MKGMSRLVEDRFDIALKTYGIHKNERQARLSQRRLIPARSLAFAVGQIEQMQLVHPFKAAGQISIKLVENALRPRDHLIHLLEWAQGRPIQRIDGQIPGTQLGKSKLPATFGLKLAHDRHDFRLNRLMKPEAIFG